MEQPQPSLSLLSQALQIEYTYIAAQATEGGKLHLATTLFSATKEVPVFVSFSIGKSQWLVLH
jgi:hypothetical protein